VPIDKEEKYQNDPLIKNDLELGTVAQIYNPGYSSGRDWEYHDLRQPTARQGDTHLLAQLLQ
jgi:predicted carbohydrate-binding protein with CBM5 and CBM33 domain